MFWPKQLTVSLWLLLCLLHTQNVNCLIVPQEVQSLLSVVYSNIPPLKKGTDSRFGFGFRFGEHADFQTLIELGPQTNTRPLGDSNKENQSFNKRQVSPREQLEQLRQLELLTSTERSAASWLESWSNGMKPHGSKNKSKFNNKQTDKVAFPMRPQMPENTMQQLQQLYKMVTSTDTPTSSTTTAPAEVGSLNLGAPSGFKLPPPALSQDENTLGNNKPKKSTAEITKELMNVSLEA